MSSKKFLSGMSLVNSFHSHWGLRSRTAKLIKKSYRVSSFADDSDRLKINTKIYTLSGNKLLLFLILYTWIYCVTSSRWLFLSVLFMNVYTHNYRVQMNFVVLCNLFMKSKKIYIENDWNYDQLSSYNYILITQIIFTSYKLFSSFLEL